MTKTTKAIKPTEIANIKKSETVANKSKGGRPRKVIDVELLKKMAHSAMSIEQIADALNCSADLLYDHYSDILREGRSTRKTKLAQAMWNNVDKGNVQMQIWMSKQHLGYKESTSEQQQAVAFNVVVNEVPK